MVEVLGIKDTSDKDTQVVTTLSTVLWANFFCLFVFCLFLFFLLLLFCFGLVLVLRPECRDSSMISMCDHLK